MKKKILFMQISMNVGGTERAFLNLLDQLPKEEFEITLLLLQRKGGFLKELPSHVIVKEMEAFPEISRKIMYAPKQKIKSFIVERQYKEAFFLFFQHVLMKLTKDRRIQFRRAFKHVQPLEENYDIAIAYAGPMDIITYFIAEKVTAVKKYQWIHFDVNKIGFDHRFAKRMYQYFYRIIVVSDTAAAHLKEKLPTCSEKIETQINTVPKERIRYLAAKQDVFTTSTMIRLVTVARIAKEKGPDIAVEVVKKLVNLGYNVAWYWVGDGEWLPEIKKKIQLYGVEDAFILIGSKSNPYPYIRQGDIYVQPSRHEGYCITIAEAKALFKPIIATATAGAKAQLEHGVTGLLAAMDAKDILKSIIRLIEDVGLRKHLSKVLQKEDVNTRNKTFFSG